MTIPDNNYVVGRGKIYFDRFADGTKLGTGEQYFGNTPALSITQANTALDHYGSESGLKVKDASVTLQNDMTGTFSTDNVSADNLALWFLGSSDTLTQASAMAVPNPLSAVKLGRFYQFGVSADTPSGVRSVTNVIVKTSATPGVVIAAAGNFELDLVNGRIYIEPDAVAIAEGDDLAIVYDLEAATSVQVIAQGSQVFGALRFISDNPVGGNKNHFYPYVKLTSTGDYALKGDDWQTMNFTLDVLQLNSATARAYVDGAASVTG